jgi:hypothetical protein
MNVFPSPREWGKAQSQSTFPVCVTPTFVPSTEKKKKKSLIVEIILKFIHVPEGHIGWVWWYMLVIPAFRSLR